MRCRATQTIIESVSIVNDEDAYTAAVKLRTADTKHEYLIDILIPEPISFVQEMAQEWGKDDD